MSTCGGAREHETFICGSTRSDVQTVRERTVADAGGGADGAYVAARVEGEGERAATACTHTAQSAGRSGGERAPQQAARVSGALPPRDALLGERAVGDEEVARGGERDVGGQLGRVERHRLVERLVEVEVEL